MSEKCPVCGSKRIEFKNANFPIYEPYCDKKVVECKVVQCLDCDYESYVEDGLDKKIKEAKSASKQEALNKILDYLTASNHSYASLERILNIPQRTLHKWKSGVSQPSAAAFTLFKFLRTFPWLLEVAEENFDYEFSQKLFLMTAATKLIDQMKFALQSGPDSEKRD